MPTLPASAYLSNNARTEGEMKTALEDQRSVIEQNPGGAAQTTLTIAGGVVTPTRASHAIDTEGAAATDDLTTIAQTDLPDGSIIIIQNASAGRVVVCKHAAGGTGQLDLRDAADLTLTDPDDTLTLRRKGTLWEEIGRHRKADVPGVKRGARFGCIIANNATDVVNDLDITAGEWASDTTSPLSRVLLTPAAMTGRVDATWVAGTNQGKRDSTDNLTGAKTFHIYTFRPSSGPDDYFFSTSLTPTLPSGTHKRRIGSRRWSGSAWIPVVQKPEGWHLIKTPVTIYDETNPGTSALIVTCNQIVQCLPEGIEFGLEISGEVVDGGAGTAMHAIFTALAATDVTPAGGLNHMNKSATQARMTAQTRVEGNTSGQFRARLSASGANISIKIMLTAYHDDLGEHA